MILKELDPFNSDDRFMRAGRAAEEQMAFYLKRFFGSDPDVLVLNGIRLEAEGDAAQVDHLIVHPFGISIVESKSVHGKVQIKDDGQWIRWFGNNLSKGMRSPITQARLQEQFFREVLGRASNNPAALAAIPFDLYVAISDEGVILWPKSGKVPGVCKADQVADEVAASIQARSVGKGPRLTAESCSKLANFLIAKNQPLKPAKREDESNAATASEARAQVIATPKAPAVSTSYICKHCSSAELEIRYAHSYFFHCRACDKNMPIKPACPACSAPAKLRKQKQEFFVDCEKCGPAPYFSNP